MSPWPFLLALHLVTTTTSQPPIQPQVRFTGSLADSNSTVDLEKTWRGVVAGTCGVWSQWTKCTLEKEDCVKTRQTECNGGTHSHKTFIKEWKACSNAESQRSRDCKKQKWSRRLRKKSGDSEEPFQVVWKTAALMKSFPIAEGEVKAAKSPDKRVYSKWSRWTMCTRTCRTQRYRWCKKVGICGNEVIRETAYCYTEGSNCQEWILNNLLLKDPIQVEEGRENVLIEEYPMEAGETTTTECGVSANEVVPPWNLLRIIGGRPTPHGKWPWLVVILNKYKEAYCGGTLVAPRWVLTAAHCVKRRLFVTIGEHDLTHREGTEMRIKVKKVYIHPNYNNETIDSDVALLYLQHDVPQDKGLAMACLPKHKEHLSPRRTCTIVGWGKRSPYDHSGTSVLHEAEVPIVSRKVCRGVYNVYKITHNMFCAGYPKGKKDTCAGDSGGPLLCKDSDGRWTIFGITSFGEGCGKRGKYGVYTKLPNYVQWIKQTMGMP